LFTQIGLLGHVEGDRFPPPVQFTLGYLLTSFRVQTIYALASLGLLLIGKLFKVKAVIKAKLHTHGIALAKIALYGQFPLEEIHSPKGAGRHTTATGNAFFFVHQHDMIAVWGL